MRNEADVNEHRTAFRAHERSNGADIRLPRFMDIAQAPPLQHPDRWVDWFLPHKETRLMADEANRAGGVFMPWPLLGIVMSLILALGGGIIGLYSQLSAMQTTLIMRDADYRREQQQTWEKMEQLQVYIKDDREKLVRLETLIDQQRRRN